MQDYTRGNLEISGSTMLLRIKEPIVSGLKSLGFIGSFFVAFLGDRWRTC